MTQRFTVFKSRENLNKQWKFIQKENFKIDFIIFKVIGKWFIYATLVYVFFYFLTPIERFITLRGVLMGLLAIAWFCLFIAVLVWVIKIQRDKFFIRLYLKSLPADQLNYHVEVNEDYIKIISAIQVNEMSWDQVKSYCMSNDTLYIFSESEALKLLYWSTDEIGQENLSFLLSILEKKLFLKLRSAQSK